MKKKEPKKLVLTMASYASVRHHGWSTKAAWTKIETSLGAPVSNSNFYFDFETSTSTLNVMYSFKTNLIY